MAATASKARTRDGRSLRGSTVPSASTYGRPHAPSHAPEPGRRRRRPGRRWGRRARGRGRPGASRAPRRRRTATRCARGRPASRPAGSAPGSGQRRPSQLGEADGRQVVHRGERGGARAPAGRRSWARGRRRRRPGEPLDRRQVDRAATAGAQPGPAAAGRRRVTPAGTSRASRGPAPPRHREGDRPRGRDLDARRPSTSAAKVPTPVRGVSSDVASKASRTASVSSSANRRCHNTRIRTSASRVRGGGGG